MGDFEVPIQEHGAASTTAGLESAPATQAETPPSEHHHSRTSRRLQPVRSSGETPPLTPPSQAAPTVVQSNVIYVSPAQYEPPPTDQRVTLRVNINTVTLTYADVDYVASSTCRNHGRGGGPRGDWHAYGRALFDAIINDAAPQHGDQQHTTAYGFRRVMDDLQHKPDNKRFQLLLDRSNGRLHDGHQ
ncbi:MAG: hypothetical protein H6644_19445 [Caldilineaceae bacterium]|nr:hypothetical protein [Caldilineaceae bacterium]